MAFDVSSLTNYTKPATEFLTSALVYSPSYEKYDIQSNIQSTKNINFVEAEPVLQEYSCAMTSTGSTKFDEKTITVKALGSKAPYCLNDLKDKDIVGEIGTGTGVQTPALAQVLLEQNCAVLKRKQDKMLWAGEVANGDLFDGWIKEAIGDSDVVDVTGATVSALTIDNVIEEMILAVPEAVAAERVNIEIHVSQKYFNMYRANRIASNMYHDDPSNLGKNEMSIFGYPEYKLVAEPGMVGKTEFFLTWNKNLVLGTDNVSELNSCKFVYVEVEKDANDTLYFIAKYKLGNTYKFGSEIVLFQVV